MPTDRGLRRRPLLRSGATVLASVAALAISATGSTAFADGWPSQPITIVVPAGTGGALDRTARALAPLFEAELGQFVNVVNRPGANSLLGHAYLLQQPDDGHHIIMSVPAPQLVSQIELGLAEFDVDDFAFLNAQSTDWSALVIPEDRPYESWAEIVEAIRANPGQLVSVGVPNSDRHVLLATLLDLAELPFESIRWVTYLGGGAEVRAAIINGQTDFAFTTINQIPERVRVAMVVQAERHPDFPEVPTIGEVLGDDVSAVPMLPGAIRSLATRASFRENHPDRWDRLVSVYREILERPEVAEAFLAQEIGADWVGPERTTEMIVDYQRVMAPYLNGSAQ